MTPVPEMFDWDLRIRNMDRVGIDVSVVSLTCPNVYWGGAKVSLKAAQVMNDEMAQARKACPDRIQWFCSLPWQHEKVGARGAEALAQGRRLRRDGARQHRRQAADRPGLREDLAGDRRRQAAGAGPPDRAAGREARWR